VRVLDHDHDGGALDPVVETKTKTIPVNMGICCCSIVETKCRIFVEEEEEEVRKR
jgi:thiamine phosphate synthase YjbQ (UPF0047 family)